MAVVKAGYWLPDSGIPVSDIDASFFTHFFYAFADLDPQNQVTIPPQDQITLSTFKTTLQRSNPSIKTLLSIGGENTPADYFSSMASDATSRKEFIDSSIEIALKHSFDGLNLDWNFLDTETDDTTNLGLLLKEWRANVKAKATSASQPAELLLTASVYHSPERRAGRARITYPVDSMKENLDWVNVKAYDYYMPYSFQVTSSHAPLYERHGRLCTSSCIQSWIRAGLARDKIVMGLNFYGFAFKLADPAKNGLGAPAIGPFTADGKMSYKEIDAFIQKNEAAILYKADMGTNYCHSGSTWICYDDVKAIKTKVKYASREGLRGFFAWNVTDDDEWILSGVGTYYKSHPSKFFISLL
uniref:GH18 domain-containing protein n=1 Tax=Nelumbo nucifera TaxID=4432 RepID=A0A822ZKZ3_NELNU|nr:TPA_asm: hypothetical protein HUJ06_003400 [Nelumbo nucifera]